MNIETAQNYIVKAFNAFWTDTPLENVNTVIDKKALSEWVRLSIIHDPSKPINFKMNALRSGCISVQVFTKPDIGQGRAVGLAEKAGIFLSGLRIGSFIARPYDIVILNSKATEGLTTTETQWFQVNCKVEFTYID